MKKKVFSLMMTLLLAFMGVARADELTVNDGSTTNSYVPVYGFYADAYLKAEFVQPAADLAAMSGATINGVTFYASQSSVSWGAADFKVFLTEVDNTTLSTFVGDGTIVYQGALSIVDGMMNVTFTEPYTYNGGNLLIGVYNLATGSYVTSSWYGVEAETGASVSGYNYNSLSSITASQRNFLPKTTFDYTPAGGGESVPYEAQIGDGTSTTGYFPFYTLYNYSIAEELFLASELTEAGVLPGEVTSLSWYANNETGNEQQGLSIWMANVSDTELTTASHVTTDMTLVYTGAMTPAIGWNEFPCNAGTFTWDGTSNVLILCQRNNGNWNSTINWQYTATEFNSMSYRYQDSGAYDVTVSNTMYTSMYRPNIIIKGVGGGGEATDTYVYDMESGLDGWTSITNGEGNGWYHSSESMTYSGYDYTGLGHNDSDGFAISQSYYNGAIDADNYLVLPQTYAIENGAYLNFFYDYANDDYPDYFEVCVATTADMPTAADFTSIWNSDSRSSAAKTQVRHNNNRYENWREVTVDLSAYAGQNVWIAFHHQDYDEYEVWIDDVTVYTGDAEALIPITEVYINDFETPVWGQQVTQNVTIPEDANYTLFESGWFTLPHGREMNPDPIYNLPDQDYYWGFILSPNEGYEFTYPLEAYINDSEDNVLLAMPITPAMAQMVSDLVDYIPEGAALVVATPYYTYEEGLHTLSTYGVGDNANESVDRLLIERPNGAWMEPYHFQLYNDGTEDVEVVLIDFLHNNGYFSMAEGTEYPFTVAATGRPGVDLYINTNIEWTDTEELNSLLAVNTSERSTHLYQIIAAPYQPYCPDVVETAYTIDNITAGTEWSMWTSEMWEEENPNIPYELHDNYTLPFPEIPEGYDAVMTFTLDHDMMLNAYVSDGECDGELNGKVALYRAENGELPRPMANNYYDGRPFHNGGGSTSGAYTSIDFETGNFSQFNNYNNTSAYPWTVSTEAAHGGTYGMMSGNAGISSSTSTFTATVNYTADGTVSFDYNARGEGSGNYIWDKCIFKIDGTEQFRYGAVNAWNSFNANVAAGQHTFTWIYEKDSSVNPTGDCFYVDNIVFDGGRMVARTPRGNRATAVELPHLTQTRSGNTRGGSMTNWAGINRGSTAYGICVYNDGTLDYGINQFDIDNLASASVINDYDGVGGMVYNPNNGHFYVSDYSNSMLYEVDADGNILNTVGTDYAIVSLAWDQTTNTLYSMDSYGWLNITDPTTGEMTDIDALSNTDVMCITANANGQLFGVLYGDTSALVSIDKTDATVTTICTLNAGCNYAQSMAFDMNDNKLYWAQCYDDSNLYEINPTTGDLTLKAANTSEICGLCIPAVATPTPPTPVDPTEHNYTAGPVIEGLNVLAGTYYLVASSTCEDFEVTIGFEDLPCPIEPVTGIYPPDNAPDIPKDDLTLRWTLNDYCNEWRIIFSSTYWPEDGTLTDPDHPYTYVSEWSSDLAESFRITDTLTLFNNTNYFWRIDQRSNAGTEWECYTRGPVFGFTTSLNAPTYLQASSTRIFEYEENVTLSWTPIEDRTYRRYRIYMDGEMVYQTPNNQVVTSWVIPQDLLTYNMGEDNGYIFNVTAVYDEGESPMSNPVEIFVSGNGTVSGYVHEQDETTPIGGVTVTITGTNEFGETETYTYITDNDGYYHGNIHAGTYGYAVATMAGYQNAETIHELPFDVVYDEETDHVDFIMDELFIAPAHVCAQTVYVEGVEGDSLVQVWWDFNFFTTLAENFEDWENTPFAWVNNSTYPWALTTDAHEGTYAFKSGNAGVHSSTSELSVTVEIPQDGQFSFDYRCQGEGTYTFWDHCDFVLDGQTMFSHGADLSGWQTYSTPITAGSHTFKWSYTKDSSVNPTGDNFTIDNIVFVGHADRADRSLHHYNIYRTDCYNDGPYNSENTVFLASAWRPDTSYFDVQWPQVPVGVYKYGVSAVYAGNYDGNPNNPRIDYPFEERESEIVWHNMCSPCIDKDMYLENEVTVNVVLNSADSPEGVQVSFENLNPGEQVNHPQAGVTLDQTGYYVFPRFRKGDYLVTVGLPGYETIQVTESIWEPRDLRYVLIEIICKVQNLYVSRTGWAMWDPQAPCPGGVEPGPTPGPGTEFSFGFEEDPAANGWSIIQTNPYETWERVETVSFSDGTIVPHEGQYQMELYWDYEDQDEWLVTPTFSAPANATLTFWMHGQLGSTYGDHYTVKASADGGATWSMLWDASAQPAAAVDYDTPITVDLSAFAGQDIKLAWNAYATGGLWYTWFIDDITVASGRNVISFDGRQWLRQPVTVVSHNVEGQLNRNGSRAATAERHLEGYKIMCTSIDGEPIFNHNTVAEQPFCQLATDQLVEGETYICKVAAIYSTGMSEYEEVAWQYGSCESYAGTVNGLAVEGSTISWDYPGGQPGPGPEPGQGSSFNVGFEGGLPEGWTTIDGNNDGYTWTATSAIPSTWTYYAGMTLDWYHSGTDAMCSGSYINGVGAITPNDYLVSPLVTLVNGSQLSFWVAATDASYPADHFGVFVSDDANTWTSVQEWTLTGKKSGVFGPWSQAAPKATAVAGDRASRDGEGLRIGTWYNYTVDLSAYAGQKYVAFRHFNCNDQYIMCLDDVTLTAGAKAGNRDYLQYSTEVFDGGVGTGGGAVYWGIRFPAADLAAYVGQNLTKVGIFTDVDGDYGWTYSGNYTVNVYLGGTTAPGTLVSTAQEYVPGDLAWHDITLTTPVAIDGTQDLWLTFYTADIAYPMSGCTYVGNSNSDFLSLDGVTWEHSTDYALDYTWMIRGTVEGGVTPPPTPVDGILGAMIFVDGEWEAFVEAPTNSYTYEGDGEEICVRIVYDGVAEMPANNLYYAMSCEECIGGLEPVCEPGAPIYGEVTADDQVRVYWDNEPGPQPDEGDTFVYDFENGSLDGLLLIDNDGDGYNWLANTSFGGHNGSTGIIYSQSYDNNFGALTPDNYIVFPQSNIANGSTFSFWACGQDASWASEHFGVAVSTTGTNASDFTTIAEWTMTAKGTKAVRDGRDQGNWYNYTVDLSDYAGMPVYIAIRHFNSTDMFYLDVDDVELGIANKGNRDGIIGYNIYRSEDNVDYALIGNVPGTATEYIDNPGEGTFYYQVTAVYANCESDPAISGENPDVNYVMIGRTGIGENSANVNLFPNPTKGNVTIQAMNMHRITVVSVLGQVVFDTELDQDEFILNMAQFNTGMYMVRVYTDEGVTVKRVTVLH